MQLVHLFLPNSPPLVFYLVLVFPVVFDLAFQQTLEYFAIVFGFFPLLFEMS